MEITVAKALQYSVLGLVLIFVVILLLIAVIRIMSKLVQKASAQAKDEKTEEKEAVLPRTADVTAAGSAGEVCLYDVSDRDAAMIMAIVADKTGIPLNELRFLSIREVKEDEV